jgi:acetylornithine deacetylase/succinyl-diaminopimelate desuccinylase-like protein
MAATDFPAAELEKATSLLESLLRIDTTNPPGLEKAAAELLAERCRATGLDPELNGVSPDRPNLTARWEASPENRSGRPLVLSCHLDVVPADASRWTHPPFSGHNDGTYVWGRGAIDMKGFAVMAIAALTRLRKEEIPINRDVIFAAVCDEEAGTENGSRWLVDERPDLLGGDPEYVINEVGGFTVHQKGRRFYPVQRAEKGVAWLRLTLTGKPGHSSLPAGDSSVQKLARAIDAIATARLPWHAGEEAKTFIRGFAEPEGALAQKVAPLLAHPMIGPHLLPLAISDPSRRASMEAILRNTATPTCLHSGTSTNVLPGSVSVDIDGRLAPGQSAADLIRELTAVIERIAGDSAHFEILHESEPVSFSTETPLFREIESVLREADPEGCVVPSIIPGFTDSSNYARLGATCYGFYPLQLPPELDFAAMFHGDDERIPIEGFHWGIETLTDLLRRFLTSETG